MKTDTYQCMCNVFQKSLLEFFFLTLSKSSPNTPFSQFIFCFTGFLLGLRIKADAHKVQKGYIHQISFSSQFNLNMSNEPQKEIQDFLPFIRTSSGTGGRSYLLFHEDSRTSHSSDDELTEICCIHISELNKSRFLTCLFQRAVTI